MKRQARQFFSVLWVLTALLACSGQRSHRSSDAVITIISETAPRGITRNIAQDANGRIWVVSWSGVYQYDGAVFRKMTSAENLVLYFSVVPTSTGTLWVGSVTSGAFYFDGQAFNQLSTREGLVNDRVIDLHEDRLGRLWFATEAGASVYDGHTLRHFTTENGLPNDELSAVIEDASGRIWLASRGGVFIYDGLGFSPFNRPSGQPFNNVRSFSMGADGVLWLGGQDGLWRFDGRTLTQIASEFVGDVHADSNGVIWTSSEARELNGWALTRYDRSPVALDAYTPTRLWHSPGMLFGVLPERSGAVWVGTLDGVCRYLEGEVACF